MTTWQIIGCVIAGIPLAGMVLFMLVEDPAAFFFAVTVTAFIVGGVMLATGVWAP